MISDNFSDSFQKSPIKSDPLHKIYQITGDSKIENTFSKAQDVQKAADEVLHHLKEFRDSVRTRIDARWFPLLEEVLDPLIDETEKLKNNLPPDSSSPEHRAYYLKQAATWIEQISAERPLSNIRDVTEKKTTEILKRMSQKMIDLIDKDLQFINKYQTLALNNEAIDKRKIPEIKSKIYEKIKDSLQALISLKKEILSVKNIQSRNWIEIDERREEYHNQLLENIDAVMNEAMKEHQPGSYIDPLLAASVAQELNYLQIELLEIKTKIAATADLNDSKVTKDFLEGCLHALVDHAKGLTEQANKVNLKENLEKTISEIDRTLHALSKKFPSEE